MKNLHSRKDYSYPCIYNYKYEAVAIRVHRRRVLKAGAEQDRQMAGESQSIRHPFPCLLG